MKELTPPIEDSEKLNDPFFGSIQIIPLNGTAPIVPVRRATVSSIGSQILTTYSDEDMDTTVNNLSDMDGDVYEKAVLIIQSLREKVVRLSNQLQG